MRRAAQHLRVSSRLGVTLCGLVLAAGALTACAAAAPSTQPGGSPSASPSADPAASVLSVSGTFRPEVSWPAVDAAHFALSVVTASGASWAWEGAERSVIIGAVPEVDWVGPGFALDGAALITFAAFAEDGSLVHVEQLSLD